MSLASMANKQAPYTRQHTFVKGVYSMGHTKVPYFNITLNIKDALSDLKLQRDVILDPKEPVNFAELFQRDVETGRVREEIVDGYLRPAHQLKFFNALTVVLLPTDPETGAILASYQASTRPGAPSVAENMHVTDVGPVQLQTLQDTEIGMISWDKDAISAVIVDGQHRFSALKMAHDDESFPWPSELRESSIPVLLLVLDPRAGFDSGPGASQLSVIAASRSIFIDLNKNAKTVSKPRQFLLDDRDLHAVAMRALIDQEVGEAEQYVDIFERINSRGQYPVALVDWHTDGAKFDHGMYATTILTLYDLTTLTIGDTEIPSSDLAAAATAIDAIIARFSIDDDAPDFGLRAELKRCEADDEPFTLARNQINAIATAFASTRGRLVIRVLTHLLPYEALIRAYAEANIVNGEYEQWAALDRRGRKAFIESLGKGAIDPQELIETTSKQIKARYPIAFQVVFQKSVASAISLCYQMRSVVAPALGASEMVGEFKFAELWVDQFNYRLGDQLQHQLKSDPSISFWHGSVVNASGTLSFSDGSRNALTSAIVFALTAPRDSWSSEKEAEQWIRRNWSKPRSSEKVSEARRFYSEHGAAWQRSLKTFERARLKAQDKPIPDADRLLKLAEKRAAQLLFGLKPRKGLDSPGPKS